MTDYIDLSFVETSPSIVAKTGFGDVERIFITADGRGPMGFYDRIHIIYRGEESLIFPAHNCISWRVAP